MWPSFRFRAGRRFNRWRLDRAITKLPTTADQRIAVTTLPLVADLVGTTPVDRWVYYCVDDLSAWPGLDRRTLERMERELVAKVDDVVVASEALGTRIAAMGREAHLLTHGVDLAPGPTSRRARAARCEGLERPLLTFWGLVDRRLDVRWIEELASGLASGTLVLVGPWNDPDPLLRRLPRVELVGEVPYDDLPSLAAATGVLVMPYRDIPATRAMQPLKLKEYLATGRPVVARALPLWTLGAMPAMRWTRRRRSRSVSSSVYAPVFRSRKSRRALAWSPRPGITSRASSRSSSSAGSGSRGGHRSTRRSSSTSEARAARLRSGG